MTCGTGRIQYLPPKKLYAIVVEFIWQFLHHIKIINGVEWTFFLRLNKIGISNLSGGEGREGGHGGWDLWSMQVKRTTPHEREQTYHQTLKMCANICPDNIPRCNFMIS